MTVWSHDEGKYITIVMFDAMRITILRETAMLWATKLMTVAEGGGKC